MLNEKIARTMSRQCASFLFTCDCAKEVIDAKPVVSRCDCYAALGIRKEIVRNVCGLNLYATSSGR